MADKSWKKFERRVCRAHGIERAGPTGMADGDAHALFSIECKLEKAVPSYLGAVMAQAISHSPVEKVPIVVVKKPGLEMRDAFVIVRFQDWIDLHGVANG